MWKQLRVHGQLNIHTMWNALRALKIIGLVYSTIDDQY